MVSLRMPARRTALAWPGPGPARPRVAARACGGRRDQRRGPAAGSAGRDGPGARAGPGSPGRPGLAAAARRGRGGHRRGRVCRLRPGAAGGAGQPPGRGRARGRAVAGRAVAAHRHRAVAEPAGRGPPGAGRDGRLLLRAGALHHHPAGAGLAVAAPAGHVRASATRIAEVLAEMELLHDDTTAAIRTWIDRRTGELPAGFGRDVRAWLVVLLDGDTRTRPRSAATVHFHFGRVRPFIECWAATRGHLREITSSDVDTVLEPLRGHRRYNAITALRSLFRFAKRRGLTFADPTAHLRGGRGAGRTVLPMTAEQIRAVQQAAATPAQRLAIALAAVHAA